MATAIKGGGILELALIVRAGTNVLRGITGWCTPLVLLILLLLIVLGHGSFLSFTGSVS